MTVQELHLKTKKMDAEEKEIRYLINKSPNRERLIDWWVNRKQQFLVLNSIADNLNSKDNG